MRGTTLANLLLMLKAELAVDSDSSVSPGGDDVLKATLAAQQKWLACEYDWPFLEIRKDINMVAGTRYYDFPVTSGTIQAFNMEREIIAECYWSNLWYRMESGIKAINYNTLNPELNQRLDPVLRWQPYNGAATVQFEVWPLPATATRVRLTGQRALNALSADSDTTDLDDMLIVLFTAAELAARYGDNSAMAKAKRAEMRLQRLRGGIAGPNKVFSMRGSKWENRRNKNEIRPMVGVNYTP